MLNIWDERTEWDLPSYARGIKRLEGLVCQALSLTKNDVSLDDLEACQHLKKKENVS